MQPVRNLLLRISVLSLLAGLIIPVYSQQADTLQNLPNLLLPKFTMGMVKFKDGKVNKAMLNYDLIGQNMVFLQKKTPMILDNPQVIDTIFLSNRIFIPAENCFLELILASPVTLFRQNKSYAKSKGTPTGYGAMSQTTPMSYVGQIYGRSGPINLKVPDEYVLVDDTDYWVRHNSKMEMFDRESRFLKIFPDREKELKAFIKKNRTSFQNPEDVKKLVLYCNELYN